MQFRSYLKISTLLFSLFAFSASFASNETGVTDVRHHTKEPLVQFQIIENQVLLNPVDITSASIEPFNYIHITLTPDAANRLELLTQNSIEKQMNIIINGELISSPIIRSGVLGPDMLIAGLTEKQAKSFIEMFEAKN